MALEAVLHHARLDMMCSLHTTKLVKHFSLEVRTWDQRTLKGQVQCRSRVVVVVGHTTSILPRHHFGLLSCCVLRGDKS